jgi:hypothetical protein
MSNNRPRHRRGFLKAAFAWLAAGLLGREGSAAAGPAPAAPPAGAADENLVKRHMRQGNPPVQPLDTMVLFERGDDSSAAPDRATTHEVLSLIHEEKGRNSYPWTLYTSLETHHETGDACVHCARLHKRGPGWSSGLHSEVFNHARAVALGVNIEMSSDYAGPDPTEVIGLNIQAVGGPAPMQYAIHIHDKQDARAHFDTAIGVAGQGKTGIDLAGDYAVGMHLHKNNLRLSEGACIELDDKGEVKIRYKDGKIEFLKGDRRIASLEMSGAERAL